MHRLLHDVRRKKNITLTHYKFNSERNRWRFSSNWQMNFMSSITYHDQHHHRPGRTRIRDKVKVMLVGGQPPDITEFYTSLASSLADAGQFLDLRPYVEKDPRGRRISPAGSSGQHLDRRLPHHDALGARRQHSGIQRGPHFTGRFRLPQLTGNGWNWDAMMNMVRKVVKDEDGNGSGMGNMGRVTLRILTFMIGAGDNPFDGVSPKSANFLKPGVVATPASPPNCSIGARYHQLQQHQQVSAGSSRSRWTRPHPAGIFANRFPRFALAARSGGQPLHRRD